MLPIVFCQPLARKHHEKALPSVDAVRMRRHEHIMPQTERYAGSYGASLRTARHIGLVRVSGLTMDGIDTHIGRSWSVIYRQFRSCEEIITAPALEDRTLAGWEPATVPRKHRGTPSPAVQFVQTDNRRDVCPFLRRLPLAATFLGTELPRYNRADHELT
jgi:hypothetical protein